MTDLNQFIEILSHSMAPQEEIRNPASAALESIKNSNFIQYLKFFQNIFESNLKNLKEYCMILCRKALDEFDSPNPTLSTAQFIESQSPGLLSKLLSDSMSLFELSYNNSGALFAQISALLYVGTDDCSILSSLQNQFLSLRDQSNSFQPTSPITAGILYVVKELAFLIDNFASDQLNAALIIIFTYLTSPSPDPHCSSICFDALSELIVSISVILENDENRDNVFHAIFLGMRSIETRPSAFKCLGKLVSHFYYIFINIGQELQNIIEIIASQPSDTFSCYFLKKLAKAEIFLSEEGKDIAGICYQILPQLLQPLGNVSCDHSEEPDDPGSTDDDLPHLLAVDTLEFLIQASSRYHPSVEGLQSIQMILNLSQSTISSPNPALREMAALLLKAVILSNEEILPKISESLFHLIEALINDASDRVKGAVIFLLTTAAKLNSDPLRSSSNRVESSLFIQFLPALREICNFGSSYSSALSYQAVAAISALSGFEPLFIQWINYLLVESAPRIISNPVLGSSILEALAQIIHNFKGKLGDLKTLFQHALSMLGASYANPNVNSLQGYILYVIDEFSDKLSSSLGIYVQPLFKLLSHNGTEFSPEEFVSISYIACRSYGSHSFDPFIECTIRIILNIFNHPLTSNDITYYCSGLSSMINTFDMTPFVNSLYQISLHLFQEYSSNYTALAAISKIILALFKHYYVYEAAFPFIEAITSLLQQICEVCDVEGAYQFSVNGIDVFTSFFVQEFDKFASSIQSEEEDVFTHPEIPYESIMNSIETVSVFYEQNSFDNEIPKAILQILVLLLENNENLSKDLIQSAQEVQKLILLCLDEKDIHEELRADAIKIMSFFPNGNDI